VDAVTVPGWLDHHDEFDVFHIQFGFDAQDGPARLAALAGRPCGSVGKAAGVHGP